MRGKEWLKWLNFNHSTRLYGSSNLQIHLLLCYKGRISFDKTTQTFIDLITPNPIWCKYQAYQIDFSCTDNINHIFQIAILPKIKLLNDIELNHNRILFYFSPCRERGGGWCNHTYNEERLLYFTIKCALEVNQFIGLAIAVFSSIHSIYTRIYIYSFGWLFCGWKISHAIECMQDHCINTSKCCFIFLIKYNFCRLCCQSHTHTHL